MKRAWAGVAVALLWAACGSSGSGGRGDDGGTGRPDAGTDGGTPDGGGPLPDGGNPDGGDGGPQPQTLLKATPDRLVFGAAGLQQLTLQNVSGASVSLQSLTVTGAQAAAFQVGGATVPSEIAPNASATVTVTWSGGAGVSVADLVATTPAGTTTVPLGGLVGAPEPSLQRIFDVHHIPVTAGNPDPAKKDLPAVPIAGDEIGLQSFVKAGDGPVTIQLLGSFGPGAEPVSIDGWYATGNAGSRTELFRIAKANAQVVDPPIESGGTLSFDPGSTPFGFWSQWPFWDGQAGAGYVIFQEDALNTWDTKPGGVQHHVRVYPYKNPDGSLDPHAYIVTVEEIFAAYGPDYNDVVFVVRNVVPAGSGGGALRLENLDGFPGPDRMVFNDITTIAACWGPLTVKDTGVVKLTNLSGNAVTVRSVQASAGYAATPSIATPAVIQPGQALTVTVQFTATDGRVHPGTLTIESDDPASPTRTVTLAGFRQSIPQNENEPHLQEIVNGLYGYGTLIPESLDTQGYRRAVGDEVLSSYWVKADASRPVSIRQLNAWHSGWDCAKPSEVSYGSAGAWFPRGAAKNAADTYVVNGALADIQRLLPRSKDETPNRARTFDPGASAFGLHLEDEYSDEAMAEQEPWCTPTDVCGHRVRFFPAKDAAGNVIAGSYLVAIDMHRRAEFGFFANYDFNDELYLLENVTPAP